MLWIRKLGLLSFINLGAVVNLEFFCGGWT